RSIDSFINANMDIKITLNLVVNQTLTLMNVDAAAILYYDQNLHMLEYAAAQGFHYKGIEKTRFELVNAFSEKAILERRMIIASDLSEIQDPVHKKMMQKEGFVACYITPMTAKGKTLGVLELYKRAPLHPNQEWLDFIEAIGAQAAIAIDNARLFHNLQTSNFELVMAYDATIQGWSHALELKDSETEGHTLRVTETTVGIAKLAGLSEKEIMRIRRGALLHDIGKMGIPDHILNKTGKLSSKEWDIVRQHPQYAYDMLHSIEFLRPVLDIPYYHHEKWDGTGYPQGLRDLQIPYAARLFAVIDVWDALTSDRIYRKAWPKKKVFAHIKEQSGKHFDPQVVELFMKYTDTLAAHKK
ncbi:MAG: HD domain-containing protein, partial [Anaerolineales bacterium]|nr:HD domain-containing protein [Anaerolineales bacterium]